MELKITSYPHLINEISLEHFRITLGEQFSLVRNLRNFLQKKLM